MPSFTLDTNCIFAIANGEREAPAIRILADAHRGGQALVAVAAISASENRRTGETDRDFDQFRARLAALYLDHLEILKPLGYWDLTFWDWCLWADEAMATLERRIHHILFPNIEYALADFCLRRGVKADPLPKEWRNAKCDVLALWSHIHHRRDVFVTSDGNFHAPTKISPLTELGAGQIRRPREAANLV